MREPTSSHDAASLLRESTLPHIERAVLTELAWHWPNVWPSVIRIAEHTGLARSTVYPTIERLAEQGIIDVTSTVSKYGKRRVIRYLIHWDKIQQVEPKNTRSTVTRLRQELAKTQQALWETHTTKNTEIVRETDIESVRGVDIEYIREPDINSQIVRETDIEYVREVTQTCPGDGLNMSGRRNVSNKQKKTLKAEEQQKTRAPKNGAPFVLPDWVPVQEWNDFDDMRKKNRKMTDRARELIVLELAKLRDAGNPPAEVLNRSTRNGWLDVYPLNGDRSPRKPPASQKFSQVDYQAGFEPGTNVGKLR